MNNKLIDNNYNIDSLFDNIKDMVINSRNIVYSAVNTEMLKLHLPTEKELIDAIEEDKTNLSLNNDDN